MEHKTASSRSDDTHKTATDSSLKKSAIKVKIQNQPGAITGHLGSFETVSGRRVG